MMKEYELFRIQDGKEIQVEIFESFENAVRTGRRLHGSLGHHYVVRMFSGRELRRIPETAEAAPRDLSKLEANIFGAIRNALVAAAEIVLPSVEAMNCHKANPYQTKVLIVEALGAAKESVRQLQLAADGATQLTKEADDQIAS